MSYPVIYDGRLFLIACTLSYYYAHVISAVLLRVAKQGHATRNVGVNRPFITLVELRTGVPIERD